MIIVFFPIVVFFCFRNPIVEHDNRLLGHDNWPQSIVVFFCMDLCILLYMEYGKSTHDNEKTPTIMKKYPR